MSPLLTRQEEDVVELLGGAWSKFVTLPELHPSEKFEFLAALHSAQRIIMARPVLREQLKEQEDIKGAK